MKSFTDLHREISDAAARGFTHIQIEVSAQNYEGLLRDTLVYSTHPLPQSISWRTHFTFMGAKIMCGPAAPPKSAMLEAIALARKNHPDLFGEKNG